MANMFGDHMVVGIFTLLVPFLVPVPFLLLGTIVVHRADGRVLHPQHRLHRHGGRAPGPRRR
jgi:uncharacterized membrane protein YbaN (DUF454 family)